MAGSITHWLYALRQGDDASVGKIWNRWYQRLCSKIAPHARRLTICDEEYIALGAIYDLCDSIKQNKHSEIDDRNELWRMLSVIALRKTRDWKKYDTAGKRGGNDVTIRNSGESSNSPVETSQSPDLTAQFQDEFRNLMNALGDSELKTVVKLKLLGNNNHEIAEQLKCSRRRVQYMLKRIRDVWAAHANSE